MKTIKVSCIFCDTIVKFVPQYDPSDDPADFRFTINVPLCEKCEDEKQKLRKETAHLNRYIARFFGVTVKKLLAT